MGVVEGLLEQLAVQLGQVGIFEAVEAGEGAELGGFLHRAVQRLLEEGRGAFEAQDFGAEDFFVEGDVVRDDHSGLIDPGQDLVQRVGEDNAFGGFPNHWRQIFRDSPLSDVTPHVLRHSFASIANDLGFTEVTIAALVGHSKGTVTSKYIHTLDTALIMAADTISGYIQGLLDGIEFKQTAYALDRGSRKAALDRFLENATGKEQEELPIAA